MYQQLQKESVYNAGFLPKIFSGGGIYCYANFFCYAIVFGPNFRRGQTASGGVPPASLWKKARMKAINKNQKQQHKTPQSTGMKFGQIFTKRRGA